MVNNDYEYKDNKHDYLYRLKKINISHKWNFQAI